MVGALDQFDEDSELGGLSAIDDGTAAPVDLTDVQLRKDILNRAMQRILQQRSLIRTPYEGANLGNLSLGASLAKRGGPVSQAFTEGMLNREIAKQKQAEAQQGADMQRSAMDMRGEIARIMSNGGSLEDAGLMASLAGDDKVADNIAKMQLYGTRAKSGEGSTIQAARALMAADPTLDFPTAFSIAKSGIGTGNTVRDGKVTEIEGSIDTGAERKGAEKAAEKQAEIDVAKLAEFPQATSSYYSTMAKSKNVLQNIDEAIPKVGTFTTGFFGKKLSEYAGTPAADLASKLDTVRANLGFDELQNMRDNSPTGGALGQVAVKEIDFLQSVWSNLSQSQSPEQLKENLEKLKIAKEESNQRIKDAFAREFKKYVPEDELKEIVAGAEVTPPAEAKQAKDGKYYVPDPQRPGKYLEWQP